MNQKPAFSPLRNFLWPIHGSETKKFLSMSAMMFFILFNYTILRNTKDALVVTAAGAEVLPFLKSGVVLPFAILFVALYAKLCNVLSRENLFYVCICGFLAFFTVFALFLYPYRDILQPAPETIHNLKLAYPHIQHIFPIFGAWTFSLFYVFAELWGGIVLALLFWQFANQITKTDQAKRFYSMFGFLGHLSLIAAGYTGKYLCSLQNVDTSNPKEFGTFINALTITVLIAGIAILLIYRWMTNNIVPHSFAEGLATNLKPKKPKLSVGESFKNILSSRYLGLIVILIIGYGLSMNILGVVWKKQLHLQFPDPREYQSFMSNFSIATGTSTVLLIFFFKGIVAKFGWFWGAIVTPLVLLMTGIPFFLFVLDGEILSPWLSSAGITPLYMAVLIGAGQQFLSKSAKYALFDPTKEMAYIPLDDELKTRGKAAVDVIGNSFSKASGGYVTGGLLIITAASDLMVIAPYLAGVVITMVIIWLFAVRALNRRYKELVGHKEEEHIYSVAAHSKAA
jgi:AAA family ATP:ADP antiporter